MRELGGLVLLGQTFILACAVVLMLIGRRLAKGRLACYACAEEASHTCESCGNRFCWEHGQRGGDRQVQDVGAVAYPSLCDDCCGWRK